MTPDRLRLRSATARIPGWTDAGGEEIDVHNDWAPRRQPDRWRTTGLDLEASPGKQPGGPGRPGRAGRRQLRC